MSMTMEGTARWKSDADNKTLVDALTDRKRPKVGAPAQGAISLTVQYQESRVIFPVRNKLVHFVRINLTRGSPALTNSLTAKGTLLQGLLWYRRPQVYCYIAFAWEIARSPIASIGSKSL